MRMKRAEGRTVWLFYHTLRGLCEERLRRRSFVEAFLTARGRLDHLRHEARMEGVPGPMRGDLASDRTADQREVAQQIEDLMTDEFVAEAERPVDHGVVVEHDAVLDGPASRQARGAKLLDVADESERSRRRDLAEEIVVVIVELVGLPADGRMVEIDLVFQHQAIRRCHADALAVVNDFDGLAQTQQRKFGA